MAAEHQGQASTIAPGTPVTFATTVHQPVAPAVNPLMAIDNWTPVLVMIAAMAGIIGLFTKHIASKIGDFKEAHKGTHEAIEKSFLDMGHKVSDVRQRIGILEQHRGADIERIVKLETNLHNIEKSQARIEHALEKMSVDLGNRIDHWSEQFAASLREVRDAKPRT